MPSFLTKGIRSPSSGNDLEALSYSFMNCTYRRGMPGNNSISIHRLWFLLYIYSHKARTAAFGSNYLDSLSPAPVIGNLADNSNDPVKESAADITGSCSEDDTNSYCDDEQIPDEWYAKQNPMAGWAGYKHPKWGGYLDNLSKNDN